MHRREQSERGAAAIEMLLVIPILLFLVFNVADAGWAIAQQNAVRGAAREAARIAATQPLDVERIADVICSDISRVDPASVEITIQAGTEPTADDRFGRVTITSGFTPITDTPWSVLQVVTEIATTLEFRLDGANTDPLPPWYPAGETHPCA